jgi:xanthine/CO dehydrogenase XdhC/CoxF family maturation factor
MLIAEDRWITGSVSGGCLERDLLLRGAFRARTRPFVVVTYDSMSDDDIGWGLGVGCNGTLDVLLERVDESTKLDPTAFAESCFRAEQKGALATVFESSDPAIPIGARMVVRDDEICGCTVAEGAVRDALLCDCILALRDEAPRTRVSTFGGVTSLVESFWPPPHLFVIGTQHDALALVTLARAMGWSVTVADASPSASTRARFAPADRLLFGSPREIARAIDRHARAVVVLMTHDYERDRAQLEALAQSGAEYLGVLGPRARTARLLADAGVTGEMLPKLHAPIGLDLGAETPREIALAILAEVQASLAGASGSRLCDKKGPIHALDERAESQWAAR